LEEVPKAQKKSCLYLGSHLSLLGKPCPGFVLPPGDPKAGQPGCRIRVVDGDSFDTAIDLGDGVVVLNMANAKHAGGGWLRGAMAQEEELCYRYISIWLLTYRRLRLYE
jgi:Uncharacterized protein conserved in bacteria (DUF2263)